MPLFVSNAWFLQLCWAGEYGSKCNSGDAPAAHILQTHPVGMAGGKAALLSLSQSSSASLHTTPNLIGTLASCQAGQHLRQAQPAPGNGVCLHVRGIRAFPKAQATGNVSLWGAGSTVCVSASAHGTRARTFFDRRRVRSVLYDSSLASESSVQSCTPRSRQTD